MCGYLYTKAVLILCTMYNVYVIIGNKLVLYYSWHVLFPTLRDYTWISRLQLNDFCGYFSFVYLLIKSLLYRRKDNFSRSHANDNTKHSEDFPVIETKIQLYQSIICYKQKFINVIGISWNRKSWNLVFMDVIVF